MGKPINTKPSGCVTTSSNCVVWQGPDISFLDLCTGDTVSDVIAALADKVCLLLNYTDSNNYDVSELDLVTPPVNYMELLQTIIDEIVALKNVSPSSTEVTACCPNEYQVPVNAYFQAPPIGAPTVTNLDDYVSIIATAVASQASYIASLQAQISTQQADISTLQAQIQSLL